MPDNDSSAAKSEPEAAPGEFDFSTSTGENPRVKKRSLRPKTETAQIPKSGAESVARELEREAAPRQAQASPAPGANGEPVRPQASAASSQPHFASTARPDTTTTQTTTSPHGTRPATLYYSTGANKDKNQETTSPMKTTTPTASSTAAPTPAPTRPAAPASSPIRPASVVDYRSNMERQAREQKSIGSLLAIVVYVLIGFFVLGSSLAGYGIYVLSQQIEKQDVTIGDLDKRYAAENQKLNTQLQATVDSLAQAQAQINRQQALILQEQEAINRATAASEANAAALRQERSARAEQEADLRDRIRSLDYRSSGGTTTQRY